MSTTNENILKSLAVLEQNLKDINSAKEQVNNVVKSSSDLAKVIESYQTTFESLSVNVKAVLDDSRKFNNDSIKKLSEQTTNFSKEIDEFKKQITRIEQVDLESHFKNLLTAITNHLDKQNIELTKKYEEAISKSDNIVLRLDQQDKETKSLKTMLYLAIGIVIIGIIITFVMK